MILRNLALLTMICTVVPLFAAAQDGDPVIPFASEDPDMSAAIAQAQASLPLFLLNTVDENGYGPEGGYLKVSFKTGTFTEETEVIWVGPFLALDGENFVGLLANEPVNLGDLQLGDRVNFTYDQIMDWSVPSADGRTYGDFTTKVVIRRISPDQMESFAARFMPDPVPSEW